MSCFNGDILQWQSFWDSNGSTIHTDVQKFTYLKSQIEGNAARVTEGFAMTSANYTRAIDLLREVRRQLARENEDNDWVLADLRRAINREIGILEAGTARIEP